MINLPNIGTANNSINHRVCVLEIIAALIITVPPTLNLWLSKLHLLVIHVPLVSWLQPISFKQYFHLSLPLGNLFITSFVQIFFLVIMRVVPCYNTT